MKIRTTFRLYFTIDRMTNINKTTSKKLMGVRETEHLFSIDQCDGLNKNGPHRAIECLVLR